MLRGWPIALLAALGLCLVLNAQVPPSTQVEVVQTRPARLSGLRLLRGLWDDSAFTSTWQGLRWQRVGQSGFLPFPAQLVNDGRSQLFFAEGRAWAFGTPRCPLPGRMGRIPLLVYVSHDLRSWTPFGSPLHPDTRFLMPLRDSTFLAWGPRTKRLPPFPEHLGLNARGRFTPLPSPVTSLAPVGALSPVRTPDALVLASSETLICLSPQDGRPLGPALDPTLGIPGTFPIRLWPRPDGRVLVLSAHAHAQAAPDLWELRESSRTSTRHGAAALNWLRLHGAMGWPRRVSGPDYRLFWTLLDPVKGTFQPLAPPQGFPASMSVVEVYSLDLALNPDGSLRGSFR